MNRKPRIAMVVHNAYGAMAGGGRGHVGGVERQTTMTARWLAARGYDVSVLTWDEGQSDEEIIDGVKVLKMCREDAGIPIIRFFNPRLSSLFAGMERANAELYYHNCAEHYTGLAAFWCQKHKRKFVYSVAHDYGCARRNPMLSRPHERALYQYGLRTADRIIVQTERQRRLMKGSFGLDSVVLAMPCPGPSDNQYTATDMPQPFRVAWVGRAAPIKRMELLLEVAARCPSVQFEIAAGNDSTPYAAALREQAGTLDNVVWLGSVAREDIPALYRRASALCCTSVDEGFPNTFLEAWSFGRPVISSFDPDELIARKGLGAFCRTIEDFVVAINMTATAPEDWRAMSHRARVYYANNHMLDVAMGRFEREFNDVCELQRRSQGAAISTGAI